MTGGKRAHGKSCSGNKGAVKSWSCQSNTVERAGTSCVAQCWQCTSRARPQRTCITIVARCHIMSRPHNQGAAAKLMYAQAPALTKLRGTIHPTDAHPQLDQWRGPGYWFRWAPSCIAQSTCCERVPVSAPQVAANRHDAPRGHTQTRSVRGNGGDAPPLRVHSIQACITHL